MTACEAMRDRSIFNFVRTLRKPIGVWQFDLLRVRAGFPSDHRGGLEKASAPQGHFATRIRIDTARHIPPHRRSARPVIVRWDLAHIAFGKTARSDTLVVLRCNGGHKLARMADKHGQIAGGWVVCVVCFDWRRCGHGDIYGLVF